MGGREKPAMGSVVANPMEAAHLVGAQAKAASSAMGRASAADKNRALLALAALLRENLQALQADNAKVLERALAAWLAASPVDWPRPTPKVPDNFSQRLD